MLLLTIIIGSGCAGAETETNEEPTSTQPTAQVAEITATEAPSPMPTSTTEPQDGVEGCDGQIYLDPSESPYVLPFAVGDTYSTGLTNCSSSYHGPGQPDQYAFDFDMPEDTPFMAARAGTVVEVINDQSSTGGGSGNYVLIDHGDGTYAYYLHSPEGGVSVSVGDEVEQGDVLGVTGRSGLAGYPHLHFIVVEDPPEYPYKGIAISFRNAVPLDVVLKSYAEYAAGEP